MGPLTARFAGDPMRPDAHAQSRTVFMGENNTVDGSLVETSRNNAGTLAQAASTAMASGHPADS